MKEKKHIITLNEHKVYLKKDVYNARPDQIALSAFTIDPPHECFAIVSVCMLNVKTKPGDILIKSYSENEGMLEQLIEQKIVFRASFRNPIRFCKSIFMQMLDLKTEHINDFFKPKNIEERKEEYILKIAHLKESIDKIIKRINEDSLLSKNNIDGLKLFYKIYKDLECHFHYEKINGDTSKFNNPLVQISLKKRLDADEVFGNECILYFGINESVIYAINLYQNFLSIEDRIIYIAFKDILFRNKLKEYFKELDFRYFYSLL